MLNRLTVKRLLKLPFYRLKNNCLYPFAITLNITSKCNLACKICNIHKLQAKELPIDEIRDIVSAFGRNIYWYTITGGEPFLHSDLEGVCRHIIESSAPRYVTIATNGIYVDTNVVRTICSLNKNILIFINVSLDNLEEEHDELRGGKGIYAKAVDTIENLKALNIANLRVGINTVISNYNKNRVSDILFHLFLLGADSVSFEPAQLRDELHNSDCDVELTDKEMRNVFKKILNHRAGRGTFSPKSYMRRKYYYYMANNIGNNSKSLPCYAGSAFYYISVDGDIWPCCVKSVKLGNLKDYGYDFSVFQHSQKVNNARKEISVRCCKCYMLNAFYINALIGSKIL